MTTIYETKKPVFNNNEKYLYVVNSIKKIPDGFEPYESKRYLMRKNIECGESVIITHKELMYLDNRTLEYLKDYTLVIDGVFNPYDTIKMYRDDIDTILVPTETISIDKDNNVTWLDSDYEGTAFRNIAVACCYGKVKLSSKELALYEFTGKLFNYFKAGVGPFGVSKGKIGCKFSIFLLEKNFLPSISYFCGAIDSVYNLEKQFFEHYLGICRPFALLCSNARPCKGNGPVEA